MKDEDLKMELAETLLKLIRSQQISAVMADALQEISKHGGEGGVIADAALIKVRESLK